MTIYKKAVCKVRGFTLLLRFGTLWRCGDSLFFEVPPLARDALVTTLRPLIENGVTVVLKEHFLGWRDNLSGESALRYSKVAIDPLAEIDGNPSEHPPVQISPHATSGLFQPWKGSSEVKTACYNILLKLAENGL
jgi:hypothetical protein